MRKSTARRSFEPRTIADLARPERHWADANPQSPSKSAMPQGTTEPCLLALKTAEPSHTLRQFDARAEAARIFGRDPETDRLLPVFEHAQIETRHSCVPIEWYREPRGWMERNALYLENAVPILEGITRDCLAEADLEPADIDAIVVVSTTGIATPSLDALLMERLQLRRDVQRLPIFGLGCAGGVIGLARAAALARAAPESRVLFLVVELCSLWFRKDDHSKSNIVATSLFGDGAAGAILSCRGEGPRLGPTGEHTWPASLDIMGWNVVEDGLMPIFSRDIPTLVRRHMREATDAFLAGNGLSLEDIGAFVCHPGGAKVVAALEDAFGLAEGALAEARHVLQHHGNMSAPTVLYVLDAMLRKEPRCRMLLTALGPGFTVGFLILDNR
jgi:alkylresorcinol/alkylpyrone synthase